MATILSCELPSDALLNRYLAAGAYADCYVTTLARPVTLAEFVEAFYTTAVFKLERLILRLAVSRPSTDAQAAQLARGELSSFAAWSVEARAPNQLLMTDFRGRTRSWFMVGLPENPDSLDTRLYFGSAIISVRNPESGKKRLGAVSGTLLGLHKLYSRILLRAARHRLSRKVASDTHVRGGGT